MAELPPHYHPAAAREHIAIIGRLPRRRVEHALRSSLPTMRHAILLADTLALLLGERGWDDPSTITPSRRIHLRDTDDPIWLVPQPLLEIRRIAERTDTTLGMIRTGPDLPTEDQPDDWKPGDPLWYATPRKPDIVPQGPDMFCGDLVLHEGPSFFTLRYDERGIVSGSSMCGGDLFWAARAPARMPLAVDTSLRPPQALPMRLLCRDDLEDEMSAEMLARMILDTDQHRRTGLRVWLPVDVPGGASLVPNAALVGLRRAVAEGPPSGATIAVADGFAGTAVAFGRTLEAAMAAWRIQLWRCKPGSDREPQTPPPVDDAALPPVREPDTDDDNVRHLGRDVQRVDLGKHTFSFGPPASSVPLPALVPDNTPATRIEIPTHRPEIPRGWSGAGFDRWVHLVGASGRVVFALARAHADRTTLVGEHVLDIVDPEALDPRIDAALAEQRAEWRAAYGDDPEFAHCVTAPVFARFTVWDTAREAPCFRLGGSTTADRLAYENIDGDELAWCVACWSR